MPLWIARQVSESSIQYRPGANRIPVAVMVKRDGHLDQALQELLFGSGSGSPDVFESLVGLEKFGTVEEVDPLAAWLEIHVAIVAQPDHVARCPIYTIS